MKTKYDKQLNRQDLKSIQHSGKIPDGLDDFERDAAEGWIKSGASFSLLHKTDRKFLRKRLLLPALAGLLLLCGAMLFFLPEKNVQTPVAHRIIKRIEVTDYQLPEKIRAMHLAAEKKQVKPSEIIAHYQHVLQQTQTVTETPEAPKVDHDHILDDRDLQNPVLPDVKESPVIVKVNKAKEIYLSDLLTIDYREYRSKPAIKTENVLLTGTPANQADQNTPIEEPTKESIEIPYFDFLKKSMAIFAKGNYKKALYRFEEILATYPDDLNARFYGGLCYFNLGEYDKAKAYFNMCQNHRYGNFKQDADWYLAKCYEATGKLEEARTLWKQIVSEGGFYAEVAKKKLNN